MLKITSEEPESYTKFKDIYTYFTSGYYMKRMHPDNSISLHVASHILTGVNVRVPATDTFYPSQSKDPEILLMRKKNAIEDLATFLQFRYSELVDGGLIYFDVMGKLPESYNFSNLIDEVLHKAISLQIVPEKFKEFGFRNHFWEKDEILAALAEFSGKLELVSYKQTEVPMPQYLEYLEDRNTEKYAEQFIIF